MKQNQITEDLDACAAKTAKHTDSPWIVNDIHPFAVYGGEGNTRRQVADCRPLGCLCHTEEDRANARLIAAAPDLLAIAVAVAEWPHKSGDNALVDAARAAIAKVKGGQL